MLASVLSGECNRTVLANDPSFSVLTILRVVFVLMVLSSIAFYAMAFRQPVVCTALNFERTVHADHDASKNDCFIS